MTLSAWPAALSRRFTPTALLGRGQFGTVFEATDTARGARVAVKALRADRPTALQAFKREFRALTDLAHDNLVALHELGREGEHWFLVMEVVDGLELRPALQGASVERTCHVFAQVALGLSFLHASGRLHRDLKPSNVRVTPAGRAVVLDFGLALDGAPEAGEGLVGAAGYLSPEQAGGADASPASDVYALGVMLHEALCGARPFEGPALEVLAHKRRAEAVLRLDDSTPGPLRAVCARMLALTPAARPSAAEVVAALDPSLVPLLSWKPEAPLVGREEALAYLERAFESVQSDGAVAVWLQGAPGLGKSALLRRFLASKRDADGVLVIASRCFEHESTPFKAVDGLVDGLAHWLAARPAPLPGPLLAHAANLGRSFPALRHLPALAAATASSSPPEAHLHESAVALRELLAFAARETRVLVCIDDLHWADTDSVPFLRELLDGEAPPPVLFLGALREEGHPLLEPFRGAKREPTSANRRDAGSPTKDEPAPSHLAPGRKDESSVAAASHLAPGEKDVAALDGSTFAPATASPQPGAVQMSAAGGPFGARVHRHELRLAPLTPTQSHHLARALLPEGRAVDALVAEAGGNPFLLHTLAGHEGGLRGAVSARVARLPPAAQRLLEVVCVAGAPLPRALWVGAAGLDIDDGLALAHLRAGQLVRVRRDGSLEPYHDSLRRAVEAELPPPRKTQRHSGLAAALEAAGAVDPELLAHHLHGAGRPEAAATQATRGAQRAMSALAFHHAAQLYAKSLEWAPSQSGAREVKAALGEALSNAGRGEGAAEALLAACEGAPPTEQLELRRRAAAQLLRTGHHARGLALTRSVLEAQGLSLANTPRGALASLVWTRARLRLRGRHFVARAADTINPVELARIDVLTSTSIGLAAVDSLRAADLMGQALLRALRAGEPARVAVCLGFETAFSGNQGGKSEARTRQLMAEADEVSAALGQPYARACALGGTGIALFHLGHLAESQARCTEASALFARCPGAVKEQFTIQLFALAGLAQRGDFAELGRRLGGYLRLAIERGDRYAEANLRAGLPNLVWLAADDAARARLEVELARAGLETAGYSVQHFFHLLSRFHLELYAGDGPAAQRVLAEGLPALERSLLSRTEWIAVAISWMRGRALLLSGVSGRALLREAEAIEKRKRPWGDALALSLRAGERRASGADPTALLARAVERCDAAGLELHAHCGRLVTARLRGDAEAETNARAAAASLGVRSVDRMARLYFPGLVP